MKSSSGCESVMLSLLSSSDLAPAPSASALASLAPASVPDESLYKCDPARRTQSAKTYTRQADINQVITRLLINYSCSCSYIDWMLDFFY